MRDRAVQWHYIDKLSNDTVPKHTFIYRQSQALFIYKRTKITGWFPVLPLKKYASARLALRQWTALCESTDFPKMHCTADSYYK